jgi:hypothetical protein
MKYRSYDGLDGYVARMGETENVYRISIWKSRGKNSVLRPGRK